MLEENMPPHFANHSSAFRLQVRSLYPDMRLFLSEGRFYIPAYFGNSAPAVWPTPQNSPGTTTPLSAMFAAPA
jgi:hypothetical protein